MHLLYILKSTINKQKFKKIYLYFLVFYFISVLSSALSSNNFISLKSSIPYLRYLGLVLITYYLCKIKKDIIEKLGLIVILIFFAFFIDSILFFLFGFNFPIDKMGNDRFSSFFGDEKVLGGYVARLAPLGLIFISAIRQEKNKKIFFSIYLLLASYLIFF